ncbi:23S rRNA (guanine(745)-N(1))-methyltransferase [uncultured Vibrio sp.]|uniref:23S rRNA (guanine(745)-N(1))-methyltransferase n=1 Tax=uncultured Vibrio sp. TaxID=114054 RepID=UPI0009184A01|nr:23S rRNA (guanine(745)-N(1))-methyltransferase [uncultured Vibrio sp.]OIQ24796.1 MAG: 23S rRNA (guanine(745)-N(1))-methyltransferase [Vibrio sp. MedPE-SWchi]
MSYSCPLCHQPLALTERTYRCANNHAFDLAKEGYINLMPVQHKRSKDPGDNKEMMQARRAFLQAGHYQPMRQAVAALCRDNTTSDNSKLLDIGCGEGYYTDLVASTLKKASRHPSVYGLDISKVAIRYAAKQYTQCHFSVASSHRLPFSDQSLDTILRIYAPCKAEELSRTLNEDGKVITVTPAARHLYQLREKIYPDVRLHSEEPEIIDGFELVHQDKLNYIMELKKGEAMQLLQMTPFAWKATEELKAELLNAEAFHCEADFMLRVYRKK